LSDADAFYSVPALPCGLSTQTGILRESFIDRDSPVNVPADCINLGQGFMNWSPPSWITEELNKSMQSDVMVNHYSHPRGRPRLLQALKDHFSPKFENLVQEGRTLKTEEVMAAAGANCGMSLASSRIRHGEETG
jgi:kynurenine aminotransferase